MTPSETPKTARRPLAALCLAAVVGLPFLTGCSGGMDQIDRRLSRVLGDSAARANLNAPPRIAPAPEFAASRKGLYETQPPTVNPGASDLGYTELERGEPGSEEVIDGLNRRLRNFALQAGGIGAENVMELSLLDALRLAQRQGREYLSAEEDYLLTAIGLLVERHRWGPRLFADSSVSVSGDGDDGRFENALGVVNSLRVTQRLPYGGNVEARWVWEATEQLRSSVSGQYRQSSALVLSGDVPLLRGSGMPAREDRIQAERNVVYAAREFEDFRRAYFVSIALDYFRLIQTINELQNRIRQIQSLELFVAGEQARYRAGRRSEFQVNQARNQLINARSQLSSAREQYTLQLDRFKVRLGIPIEHPVQLVAATIDVPEPATTIEAATESALRYRLDLQNRRDQYLDSRRDVLNARNDLLPDLDLSGSVRIPTDDDVREGGLAIDPDELSWQTALTLSLPLDRRIERLQLRQALVRLERARRSLEEFTDNVVLDARRRVREIDLARFRLELAEASVQINERRLDEVRLKEAETDVRDRLEAETDLLDAQNRRAQAITDLRVAILNYLETIGQLRVAPDGSLEALPGMEVVIDDRPIDFHSLFSDEDTDADVDIEPAPDGP